MTNKRNMNEGEVKALNVWSDLNNGGANGVWSGGGNVHSVAPDWQLMAAFANNDVVYTCADMNATQVASTKFRLLTTAPKGKGSSDKRLKQFKSKRLSRKAAKKVRKSVGDDVEVVELTEHPLLEVLTKTNEDLNGFQIWKATQLDLEVFGRAYWMLERNLVTDAPQSIKVLPAYRVYPITDPEGIVTGYSYLNTVKGLRNERVELDLDDVIDFRFVDVANRYSGGMSWLHAVFSKVSLSSKFNEYLNWLLDNRARPDALLIPEDINGVAPSEAEMKKLEENFRERARGKKNGLPLVMYQKLKYVPMSFTPTDMAPLEFNKEAANAVCNASGVPYPLISSDPKYSNIESSLEVWARRAIVPRIQLLEQVINDSLAPLFGDDLFIEFENPVPEDEQFELEESKVALQKAQVGIASGKITGNEVRAFLGLEPIDDAAEDELITPAAASSHPGTLPADEAAAAEGDSPSAPANAPESQPDAKEGGAEGKRFDVLLKLNRDVAKGKVARAIAINIAEALGFADAKNLVGFAAEQKSHEGSCWSSSQGDCPCMAKRKAEKSQGVNNAGAEQPHAKIQTVCAKFFRDLKAEAIRQTKSLEADSVTKAADTGNLPTAFVDLEHWIANLKNKEGDLAHRVKPLIQLTAQDGADGKTEALVRAGADPDAFSVVPQKVGEASDKRAYRFAKSTLQTTQQTAQDAIDAVKEKVESGVLEGDSVEQLQQAISEVFENAAEYQAERIARTEASAAVHSGQVMSAKASGIVKGFKYLVSSDACPVCADYDGEEISLDDYDDSGAVDATDAVPLHPNCTCTLTEVLDLGEDDNEGKDKQ